MGILCGLRATEVTATKARSPPARTQIASRRPALRRRGRGFNRRVVLCELDQRFSAAALLDAAASARHRAATATGAARSCPRGLHFVGAELHVTGVRDL